MKDTVSSPNAVPVSVHSIVMVRREWVYYEADEVVCKTRSYNILERVSPENMTT